MGSSDRENGRKASNQCLRLREEGLSSLMELSAHIRLFIARALTPQFAPACDTCMSLGQKRISEREQVRDHTGQEREDGPVFILGLHGAQHFAEHCICVSSFTSVLIGWLHYSLNTQRPVFKYKYENTLKCTL